MQTLTLSRACMHTVCTCTSCVHMKHAHLHAHTLSLHLSFHVLSDAIFSPWCDSSLRLTLSNALVESGTESVHRSNSTFHILTLLYYHYTADASLERNNWKIFAVNTHWKSLVTQYVLILYVQYLSGFWTDTMYYSVWVSRPEDSRRTQTQRWFQLDWSVWQKLFSSFQVLLYKDQT